MPYRIDVRHPTAHALDTLVDLGALDVETVPDGLAALMPDAIPATAVAGALGVSDWRTMPAIGRDDESVWTLSLRPVRIGRLVIAPAGVAAEPGALRIVDGPAFGTGLHPTTALCLKAVESLLEVAMVTRLLDVGTGSGILALAALLRGVRRACGLDIDREALRIAAENARLNDSSDRLSLVNGGVEAVRGRWPLVVANIRAAELMAMSTALAGLVASRGRLVVSGIPTSVASDVTAAYRHRGMSQVDLAVRDGWTALTFHPSW